MYSIAELAKKIDAKVIGDDQQKITRLAPIAHAAEGELTFLVGTTSAYHRYLENTKASAVILSEENATACPVTALVVKNPELSFARIAALFQTVRRAAPGIHQSAVVAKTALIDPSVSVGALCVIGENVVIGSNTIISPGVILEDNVVIGSDCYLYSHVTLYHHVVLGNRVMIHSGTVIGADGFGLVQNQGCFEKIPQLGSVIIGNDVEIGANTCIDRGALDNTVIKNGVKIDNLVQIAHNVVVGEHTVIAGCSSIAGSTTIGRHCMLGGASGIGGHLTLCDGTILTGAAMVTNSVKESGVYSSGTGLFPSAVWRRMVANLRRQQKRAK